MTEQERALRREQKERQRLIEQTAREAGRGPLDLPFLLLVLLLTCIGLVMLFSASFAAAYYKTGKPGYYVERQAIFAAMGIAAMVFLGRFNYERLRGVSKILLAVSVFLLILVLVPHVGITRNNATRWLGIPGTELNFQPSEIAKLGVILYFADSISKKKDRMRTFREGVLPYAVILGIVGFLMYKEPHFSGLVLIFGIGAVMMYAGGIRNYWVVLGVLAVLGVAWAYLNGYISYNSSRIAIWLDPLNDEWAQDAAFQIRQSLISIGSGGLLGLGLGQGRQKYLFVPEPQNDFIFALVCEELGFIGASFIMLLFALLILRGYWIALHARDRFGCLLAVGVTTQIALQVFLNIAVVTNLLPNTGISLPFFSYGGTALAMQLAEMGVVLSVSRQMPAS